MFLNSSKLERAKAVIAGSRSFDATSVEAVALKQAKEEGHKGEELLIDVYKRIGGAVAGDAGVEEEKKKNSKTGEVSVETVGKEVEEIRPKRGGKKKSA